MTIVEIMWPSSTALNVMQVQFTVKVVVMFCIGLQQNETTTYKVCANYK